MVPDCEGRTQEDIGKDIEKWRRQTGLTEGQLALMIGLRNERRYRRICIECKYEFPQRSRRLLAKLMNVTVDFLTPDAYFDENIDYINSIIKKGISFSQKEAEHIVIEKSDIKLNETEKRLVEYTREIINMKNEELKEDLADQLAISLKIARRELGRNKVV